MSGCQNIQVTTKLLSHCSPPGFDISQSHSPWLAAPGGSTGILHHSRGLPPHTEHFSQWSSLFHSCVFHSVQQRISERLLDLMMNQQSLPPVNLREDANPPQQKVAWMEFHLETRNQPESLFGNSISSIAKAQQSQPTWSATQTRRPFITIEQTSQRLDCVWRGKSLPPSSRREAKTGIQVGTLWL